MPNKNYGAVLPLKVCHEFIMIKVQEFIKQVKGVKEQYVLQDSS